MPHLVLRNRILGDVPLPLSGDLALVGRGNEAHIRIDEASISRIHARLEARGDDWFVCDLDSRNGTFVGDERLQAPRELADGDCLRFGDVEAVFRVDPSPVAARTQRRRTAAFAAAEPSATPTTDPTTDPMPRSTPHSTPAAAAQSIASPTEDFTHLPHSDFPDDDAPLEDSAPRTHSRPASKALLAFVVLAAAVGLGALTHGRGDGERTADEQAALKDLADLRARDRALPTEPAAKPKSAAVQPKPTIPPLDPPAVRSPVETMQRADAAGTPMKDSAMKDSDMPEPGMAESGMSEGGMTEPGTSEAGKRRSDPRPSDMSEPSPPALTKPHPAAGSEPTERTGETATEPTADASTAPPGPARLAADLPRRAPTDAERFRFRRTAYDLFGRPPSEDELAVAAAAGTEATLERWLGARERADAWFEDELYEFLLIDEFRPGEDRMDDLPGRLASGKIDVKNALAEIAKSQQFNARNPGNDTYVTVVLEQFLGITVQDEPRLLEAGKQMYDGRNATLFGKRGRSQADFVDIATAEPRFATAYITRRATALLGGTPPKADLDRWIRRFRTDPASYSGIEREILLSDAYAAALKTPRKKADRRFVAGLWHDLLGRPPGYQELRNLRNASQALTDPAGLRSLVIGAMLNGGAVSLPMKEETDAAAWIEDRFLRLLARRPTQTEQAAFLATWRKPACKPSTVLHAILTSPEYDLY